MSEQQLSIIRKFVLSSPPAHLLQVLECLRVIGADAESSGTEWLEDALQLYALEYNMNQLETVLMISARGQLLLSVHNHLYSVLHACGLIEKHPNAMEQVEKFLTDTISTSSPKKTSGVKHLFLSTFIHFPSSQLVVILPTEGKVIASVELRGKNSEEGERSDLPTVLADFLKDFLTVEKAEWVQRLDNCATKSALSSLVSITSATSAVDPKTSQVPLAVFPLFVSGEGENAFALCISAQQHQKSNCWSAAWHSTHEIRPSKKPSTTGLHIRGKTSVCIYHYEDGNVQMEAKNKIDLRLTEEEEGEVVVGKHDLQEWAAAFRKLATEEQEFQNRVMQSCGDLGESALKSLRRKLPLSKQLFDFSEATHSVSAVLSSRGKTSAV